MKKFVLAFALTIIVGSGAIAQSSDNHSKFEFFAGYSYGNAGADFLSGNAPGVYQGRTDLHGFNASAVYNISRYVGIKADVSGTYKNGHESFTVQSGIQNAPLVTVAFDSKNSLYNFLGGVQIKDNSSEARLKPFAHALVGAAHRRNESDLVCLAIIPCPGGTVQTGFAGAFGGGLDVRVNKKVDFRIVQVDYNPAWFDRGLDNNFRVGVGIVFR
jgi:opacity protein-like surface antigen